MAIGVQIVKNNSNSLEKTISWSYFRFLHDDLTLPNQSFGFPETIYLTRLTFSMKKCMLCIIAGLVLIFTITSCTATKRDCQGVKHYRLKNGIYL